MFTNHIYNIHKKLTSKGLDMKKFFFTIILLLILSLAALYIGRNPIVKGVIEKGVSAGTGLPLMIGSLDINMKETLIDIKQLQLENPTDFEERTMLNMPQIYVDYNLQNILKGTIHLPKVIIDLYEFSVVKNKDGKLNVNAIRDLAKKEKKDTGEQPKEPSEPAKKEKTKIQIDELYLRVYKVTYKDYSGSKPVVKTFSINLNEKFQNISDVKSLAMLITYKTLASTTIPRLENLDLNEYMGNISEILKSGTGIDPAVFESALEMQKQLESASEVLKTTTESLQKNLDVQTEKLEESVDATKKALDEKVDEMNDQLKKAQESYKQQSEALEKSQGEIKDVIDQNKQEVEKAYQNLFKVPAQKEEVTE
jgi:hypothetical protein